MCPLFLILALLSSADGRVRRGARGVPHAPLHPQLARRIEGSIVDHRARNAWEPPVSELTDAMARAPTKKAPLGLRMLDARHATPRAQRLGPLGTSRFDTRIDYCFVSPALAPAVASCETIVAIPETSDHNAVMVSFDLSSAAQWSER